jgi:hypothetical protein
MELRALEVAEAPTTGRARLATALRDCCGHVAADARVRERGFRFVRAPGGDVPSFFCKRVSAGSGPAAITLLAGVDPLTGDDLDCPHDAPPVQWLAAGRGGVWTVRLTVGARTISIDELVSSFWSSNSAIFATLAEELDALSPLRRASCELCRLLRDD